MCVCECIPIIYFRSVVATERVEDGVGVVLPRLDTLREQLHLPSSCVKEAVRTDLVLVVIVVMAVPDSLLNSSRKVGRNVSKRAWTCAEVLRLPLATGLWSHDRPPGKRTLGAPPCTCSAVRQ